MHRQQGDVIKPPQKMERGYRDQRQKGELIRILTNRRKRIH
jgi:hypothetical protein